MELYELTTCSFLVKFRVEEVATAGHQARWHGRVSYIPSGQDRTFEGLDALFSFMFSHLRAIGITLENNRTGGESH